MIRYVERNALRANLVSRAEEWLWSSLNRRIHARRPPEFALADWPLPMPDDWLTLVNQPDTEAELESLRRSACRGTPYGSSTWQTETARRLGLAHTLRERGRPRTSK